MTSARIVVRHGRQGGMSIVEIMVGLVIGLIATAVIFQTFSVAESFKRNTTSAGDAQQTGLFSTFTLALELANAGNGLANTADALNSCPKVADPIATLRPIPVVLYPSGEDSTPDAFMVNYSVSANVAYGALFVTKSDVGADYRVQSPTGFRAKDMVIAIDEERGRCARTRVNDVSAPDGNGVVTISHTGASTDFSSTSLLFNMGPWGRGQRVRYEVKDSTLRSIDLTPSDPGKALEETPVPLASNIVNMKVQYGVDTANNGVIKWIDGKNDDWKPDKVLGADVDKLRQIRAVRIGFVVRSAQYERELSKALAGGTFKWLLFDCDKHDDSCGSISGEIAPDKDGGGYRYRVFETVVPLRNALWNRR